MMRFKNVRNGDHMMVPFQCNICHFQNLKGRMPLPGCHQGNLLLLCLCRVILDSFWSRKRSTVNSNRLERLNFFCNQELLGLEHKTLPYQGPYPVEYIWGFNLACVLVMRSLDKGNYTNKIQFETIWKMRTFISDYTHTSRGDMGGLISME